MSSRIWLIAPLVLALTACANTGGKTAGAENTVIKGSAKEVAAAMDSVMAKAATQPATSPAVNNAVAIAKQDPMFIPFDKMNAKLTPEAEAQINAMLPALGLAKEITVRGHTYRREIGNAPAAAKARAESVKAYLIKSGIPASKIIVRFDTERPLHGVRVSFTG